VESNRRMVKKVAFLEDLKQLHYPREFRIENPKWPDFSKELNESINRLLLEPPEPQYDSKQDDHLLALIVDIGTVIWRLKRRTTQQENEVPEKLRRISRDLESASDMLKQSRIELKDHTGQLYDTGMALRVIAFQPTAGIARERIIETIKPTIYYKDKIVHIGEVIVGVPENNEATK
jgi:hypothetical protein